MSTENTAPAMEKIGALWKREGKNGVYYSGEVTVGEKTVNILVFPFKTKSKENLPDAKIVLSPKQTAKQKPVTTTTSKPQVEAKKAVATKPVAVDDDEVNF